VGGDRTHFVIFFPPLPLEEKGPAVLGFVYDSSAIVCHFLVAVARPVHRAFSKFSNLRTFGEHRPFSFPSSDPRYFFSQPVDPMYTVGLFYL